jgi:predicted dehydrogenase
MKKKLNVGFVGSGRTAMKHAEVIKTFKDYSLVSVYSRNIYNSKKFANKLKIKNYFNKINKFINHEKYDLIVICLPPNILFKYIKLLINLDANIFIEKPIGINLSEAYKILNLYKKRKFKRNKFIVGYNRRFLGSVLKLKNILSKNSSSRFIDIQDQQDLKKAKIAGHDKNTLKHWMYANSIHVLDFLNFLARGEIKKIDTKKIKFKNSYVVISNIAYSSGDYARYTGYWNLPANWSVLVSDKKNFLKINPLEKIQILNKNKIIKLDSFYFDEKFKPGFYYQFKEIDRAIKNKKNYAVGIFDAIKSVKIVNKIYGKFKQ